MTAVSASSSGSPAATSAPKTKSSTIRVNGTDRSPACASCWLNASFSALPELIEPASPTKKPVWRPAILPVAVVIRSIRFIATSCFPRMSNSTMAVCPSAETWSGWTSGERRFLVIAANGATVAIASLTVARKAGSAIVSCLLWTSTISVCGSAWKPACLRIWSALWAWPTVASCWSICFVPTAPPTATAITTNASQPNTAVFQ